MSALQTFSQTARTFFSTLKHSRDQDEKLARENKFLREAVAKEKLDGHRIATIARTIALCTIAPLLPFINPTLSVLYYELLLVVFIAIGLLQWRYAQVGRSRLEMRLIMVDLALLTIILVIPNPFLSEPVPTAFSYHFDLFKYFFVFLGVATLAYSWRTVWTIGGIVASFWLLAVGLVWLFGFRIPEQSERIAAALPDNPIMADVLDPNSVHLAIRAEEVVIFVIVAGILSLKGWRSNQLLLEQASIAAERANLSRYFPPNMVDLLASGTQDPGAVRSQNIAVLFTDIVGFTQLAEDNTPERVMGLLRRYHSVIEQAIFENSGTLDKYLGDGVMATFGTPNEGPDDALNALLAARQIIRETDEMNNQAREAGDLEVKVSIGVHYGPAILGGIGPQRRQEFAVVGDTVNVASRLEAQSRKLNCQIVFSDDIANKVESLRPEHEKALDGFVKKKNVKLRGRHQSVTVWTG